MIWFSVIWHRNPLARSSYSGYAAQSQLLRPIPPNLAGFVITPRSMCLRRLLSKSGMKVAGPAFCAPSSSVSRKWASASWTMVCTTYATLSTWTVWKSASNAAPPRDYTNPNFTASSNGSRSSTLKDQSHEPPNPRA